MRDENKMSEEKPEENSIIIDDMTIPVKNPEVTIREEMEEDGKFILFNAENELILVINTTGKFILDNCDGKKNLIQIIEKIQAEFTLKDDTDLHIIVKEYMGTLLKAKLINIG